MRALTDGICGNKSNLYVCPLNVLCSLFVPAGNIVQILHIFYVPESLLDLSLLLAALSHHPGSHKRWITEDIRQLPFWHNIFPVKPQGVAVYDGRALLQWQSGIICAELVGRAGVHLVIHQPHTYLRNLAGEVLILNTVELLHADLEHWGYINHHLICVDFHLQDLKLQDAQFPIGDNQEITAATGWVNKLQAADLIVKAVEQCWCSFDAFKLLPKLIHE
ncbi:hypothetical protein SDC9_90835 [bioreactor metagenome]|uniref:Uncharacterized protein n=1 Tax=bioreactor metagenome TaxID=1076179 RepID=A0A644ZTR4_9ZZZZ